MTDETKELDEAPAAPVGPAPEASREHGGVPWLEIALTIVGIALLAGLVLAVPALRHAAIAAVHGETSEVREQIKSLGAAGPLIIIGLAVVHSVIPYPAEIVNAAAGFAYGFFGGLAIVCRRLDDLGADLLLVRHRGGPPAARTLVRRRALRQSRTAWSTAAASPC